MRSSGIFPLQDNEFKADPETFMRVINRGKTMGKLRIAIREKLFEAREAIAAIIVSTEESPRLPRIRAVKNRAGFWIRFPISRTKKRRASSDNIAISIRLYSILERMMASGLVIV